MTGAERLAAWHSLSDDDRAAVLQLRNDLQEATGVRQYRLKIALTKVDSLWWQRARRAAR